mgnify:CR=1 FL=1
MLDQLPVLSDVQVIKYILPDSDEKKRYLDELALVNVQEASSLDKAVLVEQVSQILCSVQCEG